MNFTPIHCLNLNVRLLQQSTRRHRKVTYSNHVAPKHTNHNEHSSRVSNKKWLKIFWWTTIVTILVLSATFFFHKLAPYVQKSPPTVQENNLSVRECALSVDDFYINYEQCCANIIELKIIPARYEAVLESFNKLYEEHMQGYKLHDSFMEIKFEFEHTTGISRPRIKVWYLFVDNYDSVHIVQQADTLLNLANETFDYMVGETDLFPYIIGILMPKQSESFEPTIVG